MVRSLNILIPVFDRPASLAVTLAGLACQTYRDFDVILSDQAEDCNALRAGEVQTSLSLLRLRGNRVFLHRQLSRRGIAEQRQFLLEESNSYYVLCLDDDLILEPDLVERLMRALREENCGFADSAPVGLSSIDDKRLPEQHIGFREGPVRLEGAAPGSDEGQRQGLHSAANVLPVRQRFALNGRGRRKHRVARIGTCVLYDVEKLDAVGGFRAEDLTVQARLLERYGGCGIIPSGAFRQELPTKIEDRSDNAADATGGEGGGSAILVEVPAGELIDKITILEIKSEKIADPGKHAHISRELEHLRSVRDGALAPCEGLERLVLELLQVNRELWQIEDEIRDCERRQDFGTGFVRLARAVYHKNDRRADLKRTINELTGSRMVEEKSYAFYKAG
jgi:glycosyltransferase involved in cell wall biosynthesis